MSTKLLTLADLRDLHSILPEGCVIAGGCIRDMWFNQPPRDIDIFVPYDLNGINSGAKGEWWNGFNEEAVYKRYSDKPSQYDESIFDNLATYSWRGYELNLITLKSNEVYEHISSFDAGINMGYFDGYLVYPNEFVHDAVEKKYTLFEDGQVQRERAERFSKKLGLTIDNSKIKVVDAEWGQPDRGDGARF